MIIVLILLIIIEVSQIIDIVITEYAINGDLLEEGNPLFKKKRVRFYIGNPLKIGLPIYLYCMFYAFYKYIEARNIIFGCLIGFMFVDLIVSIYNSVLIISAKKEVRNKN